MAEWSVGQDLGKRNMQWQQNSGGTPRYSARHSQQGCDRIHTVRMDYQVLLVSNFLGVSTTSLWELHVIHPD